MYAILLVIIGYTSAETIQTNTIMYPGINVGVVQLFFMNLIMVGIYLIFSLSGIPGILILSKFLFGMGKVTGQIVKSYDLSVEMFILKGTMHGIGEFIIVVLILIISVQTTLYWVKYLFDYTNVEPGKFYEEILANCKLILGLSVPILLFSAFIELYYSKPNFSMMIKLLR